MGKLTKVAIENILTLCECSKNHLWKDEIGDVFVLTKRMEIYAYSKTVFGCYCWSRKTYLQLKKIRVIFNEWSTDDRLYTWRSDIQNLPSLLALGGTFKRRPYRNGRWIKSKEKLLGHIILPFKFSGISKKIFKKATFGSGLSKTDKIPKPQSKEFEYA